MKIPAGIRREWNHAESAPRRITRLAHFVGSSAGKIAHWIVSAVIELPLMVAGWLGIRGACLGIREECLGELTSKRAGHITFRPVAPPNGPDI